MAAKQQVRTTNVLCVWGRPRSGASHYSCFGTQSMLSEILHRTARSALASHTWGERETDREQSFLFRAPSLRGCALPPCASAFISSEGRAERTAGQQPCRPHIGARGEDTHTWSRVECDNSGGGSSSRVALLLVCGGGVMHGMRTPRDRYTHVY